MTRKVLAAIAALGLVYQAALADDDSLEERIRVCAGEANDARRLACFDREAGAPSEAGEKISAETEPAPVVVADTASPPVAENASTDDFGMTPELARSKRTGDEEAELREISATVLKVSKRPRGELVVTLDNGQTWTEKNAEYGFRVKVGDTIVIKKGKVGGYRMVGRGRRASQVRRIE